MEHDVVTQTWGAVNADEDAVLDGRAKAHRQPVRPCARPLVVGPRVRDQTPSFTEDVGGASCENTTSGEKREEIRLVVEADKRDGVKLDSVMYKHCLTRHQGASDIT